MTDPTQTGGDISPDLERRMEEIGRRFLDRLQAGEAPDTDAILRANEEISGPLEEHLALVEAIYRARPEGPNDGEAGDDHPARIGPYELRGVLGEGGMGVVYLADQTEPIERRVALKVVKIGMDTADFVARFETERQALALMDHPGIARVFDAGATEGGRPYFVMEFVPGVSVTEYCDSRSLTTPDRLQLFVGVCEAVQHAHQKGIIHRDLKPSNILVVDGNGRPSPKVIDFGVAKATRGRLTGRGAPTEHDRILGTPEYMSPEQAEGGTEDLDTRTDIYSLGVILYELLVGAPPLEGEGLRSGPLDEIRRRIREEEPQKPSTRASRPGSDSTVAAERRRSDPGSLARLLRGDLDWITMKALEKDRTRRYPSASELAADITRHLRDEPVLASPPSRIYRMRKFIRKHRGAVGAAAALGLVLAAGLALSTSLYFKAKDAWLAEEAQRARAVREREGARKAQGRAEEAQRAEAEERARAQREAEKATAISEFLQRMLSSLDPARHGREATLAEVLDCTADDIGAEFSGHPDIEASLRDTVGRTYRALGRYEEAERHLERALEIRSGILGEGDPATLHSMEEMAVLRQYQGRLAEAEVLHRRTLDLRRRHLGDDHIDTLASLKEMANLKWAQGKGDEAEALIRKVLEAERRLFGESDPRTLNSMQGLAMMRNDRGRPAEAEKLLRRVLQAQEEVLGLEHPDTLGAIGNLATVLGGAGRYDEAEALYRKSLAARRGVLGDDHPDTLVTLASLALLLRDAKKPSEAEAMHREALEGLRRVLGDDHPNTLTCTENLVLLLHDLERHEEAEPLIRRALEIRRRDFGEEHPRTLSDMRNLADLLRHLQQFPEAEELQRDALEASRRTLGEDDAVTLGYWKDLARILADAGNASEAETCFRRALEGSRRALGRGHPDTLSTANYAAIFFRSQGRPAEAEVLYRENWEIQRSSRGDDDGSTLWWMYTLVEVLADQGKLDEAERLGRRLVAIARKTMPRDDRYRSVFQVSYGRCLIGLGRYPEAEKLLVEGYESLRDRLGAGHARTRKTVEQLIDLYTAWEKPEKADSYRALLEDPEVQRSDD